MDLPSDIEHIIFEAVISNVLQDLTNIKSLNIQYIQKHIRPILQLLLVSRNTKTLIETKSKNIIHALRNMTMNMTVYEKKSTHPKITLSRAISIVCDNKCELCGKTEYVGFYWNVKHGNRCCPYCRSDYDYIELAINSLDCR